jgi:CheY-like chemotaxis protein
MKADAPRIVIVDDDLDFLDSQRRVLAGKGYAVTCFLEAAEAVERLPQMKPDLLITDLMMKTLDAGFALARQLSEAPALRDLPVIIVTAIASRRGFDLSPAGAEDLASMHADAFLEKPVAPATLLATVERLLAGRPRGPQAPRKE